jgi:uncharacterized protein YfdQ (DUF2303 family)
MTDQKLLTEAAVVADAVRESERFGASYLPDSNDVHINVLRSDEHLHVASHERYDNAPRRARGVTSVTDVASFVALLEMPEHQGSVIFADESWNCLTAIVNYHGWRDHQIMLKLKLSEQFARWSNRNGHLVSQTEFAELIEESLADIAEPPAADMLELAQSFRATKNVDFEAGKRLSSGEVKFRYIERIETSAGSGGEMKVPEQFTLHLPVWRGGATIALKASLRHRIGKDGLLLGFKISQLHEVMSAAFDDVVASLEKALPADANTYTIVCGHAPGSVEPLQ